jgi:hypothetical protein
MNAFFIPLQSYFIGHLSVGLDDLRESMGRVQATVVSCLKRVGRGGAAVLPPMVTAAVVRTLAEKMSAVILQLT